MALGADADAVVDHVDAAPPGAFHRTRADADMPAFAA